MSMYPPPGGRPPGEQPQEPWRGSGQQQGQQPAGYGPPVSGSGQGPGQGSGQGQYPGQQYPGEYPSQQPQYPQYPPPGAQAPGAPTGTPPGAPYYSASAGHAAHSAQAGAPGGTKRSRAPLIIGVVVGVLLLICGIGTVVALVSDDSSNEASGGTGTGASPTTGGTGQPDATKPAGNGATPTDESVEGDLDRYKKGDCLTVDEATNKVDPAECSDRGAYRVLLRKNGTTSETACNATDATMTLYQDGLGTSDDFVLCIAEA